MNSNIITGGLPKGQSAIEEFPRFGLSQYANRYKKDFGPLNLTICGEVKQSFNITHEQLNQLTRKQLNSDFHCVTTWTKLNLNWSGFSFVEFFERLIAPHLDSRQSIHWVVFKCLDGYRARMLLTDLLDSNILLADTLNDQQLNSKHGAPLRIVAPDYYGYKSPKHLKSVEFHTKEYRFKPPLLSFMEHPRGRVEFEERGQFFPGWLLRWLYRPLIKPTIKKFKQKLN